MGAGLCPSADHADPSVVATVCLVCLGVAGGGEFGCHTAVAREARRRSPAAACRFAATGALGLEPGQRHSALAPRGQKLVGPSLALHSIQLGCTASICVLTSAQPLTFTGLCLLRKTCNQLIVYPQSFYVIYDGFTPNELGLPGPTPTISFIDAPNGSAISSIAAVN